VIGRAIARALSAEGSAEQEGTDGSQAWQNSICEHGRLSDPKVIVVHRPLLAGPDASRR
jgi:hypothetical protein